MPLETRVLSSEAFDLACRDFDEHGVAYESHSETNSVTADSSAWESWDFDDWDDGIYGDDLENDGQPSEYEEWQDLYGGDDRYDYGGEEG